MSVSSSGQTSSAFARAIMSTRRCSSFAATGGVHSAEQSATSALWNGGSVRDDLCLTGAIARLQPVVFQGILAEPFTSVCGNQYLLLELHAFATVHRSHIGLNADCHTLFKDAVVAFALPVYLVANGRVLVAQTHAMDG